MGIGSDVQDALPNNLSLKDGKAVFEKSATFIQKSWRKHKLDKLWRQKDKAARCIQKCFRRHSKKTFELLTSKAVIIQRAWKNYVARGGGSGGSGFTPLLADTMYRGKTFVSGQGGKMLSQAKFELTRGIQDEADKVISIAMSETTRKAKHELNKATELSM